MLYVLYTILLQWRKENVIKKIIKKIHLQYWEKKENTYKWICAARVNCITNRMFLCFSHITLIMKNAIPLYYLNQGLVIPFKGRTITL